MLAAKLLSAANTSCLRVELGDWATRGPAKPSPARATGRIEGRISAVSMKKVRSLRYGAGSSFMPTHGGSAGPSSAPLFSGSNPGRPASCPGPQKIVPPDRTEGVQHLTTKEEPRMPAALHRPRINLGQAYPTTRDLRLLVPLVSGPRQL